MVGRRVFEAAARTLPLLALFFIPILFAMPTLFMWARPDVVANDAILKAKAPYLNVTFFMVRAVVYFVFWIVLRMAADEMVGGAGSRRAGDRRGGHGALPHAQRTGAALSGAVDHLRVDRLGDVARSALVLDDLRTVDDGRLRSLGAGADHRRARDRSDLRARSQGT